MEPKDYCSVLDVEDNSSSPYMCIKYRNRLATWEDAFNDLNAFRKLLLAIEKSLGLSITNEGSILAI